MNMFNWLDDAQQNSGRVVSSRFWIYWVATVPLTLAVMGGWYIWYRTADAAWRREAKVEMEESEDHDVEEGEVVDVECMDSEKGSVRSNRRSASWSIRTGKR
jgi:hypothetical protein